MFGGTFVVGFGSIGFLDIFLERGIADKGVLVEFRRVLGVTRVEGVFIFG